MSDEMNQVAVGASENGQAVSDDPATEPDYKTQWLRAMADYRNLQRETEVQKSAWAQFATADLVARLVPVLNHFTAAMAHVPADQQTQPWVIGIFHIQRQLIDVLTQAGVEQIPTVGQQFNPAVHEAVGQQPSAEVPDGVVISQAQAGYTLNGKTIAPAKVIVSSGPLAPNP